MASLKKVVRMQAVKSLLENNEFLLVGQFLNCSNVKFSAQMANNTNFSLCKSSEVLFLGPTHVVAVNKLSEVPSVLAEYDGTFKDFTVLGGVSKNRTYNFLDLKRWLDLDKKSKNRTVENKLFSVINFGI